VVLAATAGASSAVTAAPGVVRAAIASRVDEDPCDADRRVGTAC
jgi:hypothetical protein